MNRRDLGTVISAFLPLFGAIAVERIVGPPLDGFFAWDWAPVILIASGFVVATAWSASSRRWFGASTGEFQSALDKLIDYTYVLPPAARPPRGISTEGAVLEHAPHTFRRDWYEKLGLPEPRPHRSRYR